VIERGIAMKRVITFTALSAFVLSAGYVVSRNLGPSGGSNGLSGRVTPVSTQPKDEKLWMTAK